MATTVITINDLFYRCIWKEELLSHLLGADTPSGIQDVLNAFDLALSPVDAEKLSATLAIPGAKSNLMRAISSLQADQVFKTTKGPWEPTNP